MQYRRKKGDKMGAILSIERHNERKAKQIYPYSITDMIFDRTYRKKTYEHYNNEYQETEEEKEIFDAWARRRKGNK
jgi:hypothetical protein